MQPPHSPQLPSAMQRQLITPPPPVVRIPREKYVVEIESASTEDLLEAFTAPPVERIERAYLLGGGLLYLGGMVIMAWNTVMTVRAGLSGRSAPLPAVAAQA